MQSPRISMSPQILASQRTGVTSPQTGKHVYTVASHICLAVTLIHSLARIEYMLCNELRYLIIMNFVILVILCNEKGFIIRVIYI